MNEKKKIALALGSGSARGWSHIGVIKCLSAEGIFPDIVCGSSIGSVVGGAHAAGSLESLEKFARNFSWLDFLIFMDVSLSRRGLLEGERITEFFRDQIADVMIEDLIPTYSAVAADLHTGKEVVFRKGSLLEAMRASFSLPGLFTPVQRGQQWLVDGGLVNPVPVSVCRAMGADLVIAVYLNDGILEKNVFKRTSKTNNNAFQEKLADILRSDFISANFPVFKKIELLSPKRGTAKTPGMIEALARSIYIMQDRITRLRLLQDPPDILISPGLADIGLLEFNRANETIQEGWTSTKMMIPKILSKIA